MLTVKVDSRGIRIMAKALARASAQPYEKVLRLETASMIKICELNARIASQADIKRNVVARAEHNYVSPDESIVSVNSSKNKGRVWFAPADIRANPNRHYRSSSGKTSVWFMVFAAGRGEGWHLPDFYWQAFLLATQDRDGYIKTRIAELKKRRGLMCLSWLQIADQLGVPLASVGPSGNLREETARAARGPKGRTYANGRAEIRYDRTLLAIVVTNQSPLAIKRQGQRELDTAIIRRTRLFEIAVAKGFFDDLKFQSSRWPGIFVSQR